MLNSFKLSLQYILPKLWLTRLAGWGASKRAGWLTKLVIDLFVKYYKVDMKEAQKPDTASYRTFNDFFVRPLRDDARPINTVIPLKRCWLATIRWRTNSATVRL